MGASMYDSESDSGTSRDKSNGDNNVPEQSASVVPAIQDPLPSTSYTSNFNGVLENQIQDSNLFQESELNGKILDASCMPQPQHSDKVDENLGVNEGSNQPSGNDGGPQPAITSGNPVSAETSNYAAHLQENCEFINTPLPTPPAVLGSESGILADTAPTQSQSDLSFRACCLQEQEKAALGETTEQMNRNLVDLTGVQDPGLEKIVKEGNFEAKLRNIVKKACQFNVERNPNSENLRDFKDLMSQIDNYGKRELYFRLARVFLRIGFGSLEPVGDGNPRRPRCNSPHESQSVVVREGAVEGSPVSNERNIPGTSTGGFKPPSANVGSDRITLMGPSPPKRAKASCEQIVPSTDDLQAYWRRLCRCQGGKIPLYLFYKMFDQDEIAKTEGSSDLDPFKMEILEGITAILILMMKNDVREITKENVVTILDGELSDALQTQKITVRDTLRQPIVQATSRKRRAAGKPGEEKADERK